MNKLTVFLFTFSISIFSFCNNFKTVCWNLESGKANIDTISAMIDIIQADQKIQIFGFSEVQKDWYDQLLKTCGPEYKGILGTTGKADRLVIIFDSTRFTLISTEQLNEINPGNKVRSPLVAKLKDKSNGNIFNYCVNHRYRSKAEARQKQASQLLAWTKKQNEDVILVGDFNFDWDLDKEEGNKAFKNLTSTKEIKWDQVNFVGLFDFKQIFLLV